MEMEANSDHTEIRTQAGRKSVEYTTAVERTKKINLSKRMRSEPNLNHTANNYWSKKLHYYLFCILVGNGIDMFPIAVRFSLELSGGLFVSSMLFFTFLFGMPMIYMEIFLGKYTRLTNTQMYRMAPLFYGFSLLLFIINTVYIPRRATDISFYIIASLKMMIDVSTYKTCPNNQSICYDYLSRGKFNKDCNSSFMSFTCPKLGRVQYISSYIYGKNFSGLPDDYPLWQYVVACVITWIGIISLCIMGMRLLGMLLRGMFILNTLIYTIIFIMAITVEGWKNGIMYMFKFHADGFNMYNFLMIGFFTTMKLGLITPSGHMTYAAYTDARNTMGSGTEALIISLLNTLMTVYYLIIVHAVGGVLEHNIGIDLPQTFVPFVGLYVAMIPEFLIYMDSPTIFIIIYFLSNWALEVVILTLLLFMHNLQLYDYFPKIAKLPNYVIISTGLISTIMSFIFSRQVMTNYISLIIILCRVYTFQCLMLFIESLMVFYCYGVSRLNDDIHFVTGRRPIRFWRILWYIYPIVMAICLFAMLLRGINLKHKLPIQNDILDNDMNKNFYYYSIGFGLLSMGFIFLGSFIYVIIGIRQSTVIICLLKPQFFWGPQNKKLRVARKQFVPRTSIRSQPTKKKKQRFRPLSIKQMHEKDIAEQTKRGRIFSDTIFFTTVRHEVIGDTKV